MKKLLCIILSIMIALFLVSCADTQNSDGADSETAKNTAANSGDDVEDIINFTPVDETEAENKTEDVTEQTTEQATEEPAPANDPAPYVTDAPANNDPAPVQATPGTYSSDPLISRMTFLGDSTTYGLKFYGIVGDNQVWTPSNGTLALFRATTDYIVDPATGAEYSVADMCAKYTPDILVITLGVNGISMLDESGFKMYYGQLIDAIKAASPSTKIALQTMYPLSASYDTSSGINNEKIANGNRWIGEVASSYGVAFINSATALVDSTGFRPEAWNNGDGLHMSPEGFSGVMNYMISHPCY
ncbi:MAG: hypothetical protein IKN38_09345 [Clostridia bacterium]|nr:hypothetical protein [Clostridia bacterium]